MIQHHKGAFGLAEVGDAILGENGKAVGADHFRDTVIDLRIQMIGTAGQHDALGAGDLHELQDPFSLGLHIAAVLQQLLPPILRGGEHLLAGKLGELPEQGLGDRFEVGEGHVRMAEDHLAGHDVLYVVLDVLRIGRHNGTVVMVVRLIVFRPLIEEGRIENKIRVHLVDEPLHVPVRNLGRVAFGLGGDGLDAHFINGMGGKRREDNPIPEFGEEDRPEGVVLVHVQNPRNADRAANGLLLREGLVAEQTFQLVLVHIGDAVVRLLETEASLAAVAGDELASVVEVVDGQAAIVVALPTVFERGLEGKRLHFFQREHRRG